MDIPSMVDEIDEYGFTDTSPARKVAKLQEAIWQIEAMEPWPFLETSVLLDFSGDSGVPFQCPTNIRAVMRVRHINKGYRVKYAELGDAEDVIGAGETTSGDPLIYYFIGNTLNVWPIPIPSAGLLKLRYIQWSDDITANSTADDILIPKYFHEAIVLKALVALYVMEDDTDLAAGLENIFEDKVSRMRAAMWQQQFDQPEMIHSVDPEEWDYETA